MNNQKLLVFDWNGTILADTQATWKAANHCLEFFGAQPISLHKYRETTQFPILHFYKLNGCCVDEVLKHQHSEDNVFHRHYERYAKNARTRAGTRDLLKFLTSQNIDRTILSNYVTSEIEKDLERLKLKPFFMHVCGNDDGHTVLQHTTKIKRLSAFLIKRGYRPENVTIIGDSTEEPEIAKQLGLNSISITGGHFSERRLRKARPDYLIHNLSEIKNILVPGGS